MKTMTLAGQKESDVEKGHTPVFNMQKIDSFYNEQFKGLRAKIEYKIDMVELRVLAVTSAVTGEGKTLTAINLAVSMAATGRKKVVLVDLDLRKASIARMLGMAKGPGLSEYLFGSIPKEEIVRSSSLPGLSIIPGGMTVAHPTDMLAGDKFRSFLRELRTQYDLVILDTPPVIPVPDAVTIAEQVDAFILLFRLQHTPHHMFRQSLDDLGDRKIMGVVLNGEEKKSDKYYNRYYGKYYTSGQTEGTKR